MEHTLLTSSPLPSPSSPPPPISTPTTLAQTKHLHTPMLRHHLHPSVHLNSLIASYTNHHNPLAALTLYSDTRRSNPSLINIFTLPSLLKSCALLPSLRLGTEIHSFAIRSGLYSDLFVHNSLLHMYSECGAVQLASHLFRHMPVRDAVSWSTMVKSYTKCKRLLAAEQLVRQMLLLGVKLSEVAMINVLSLFTEIGNATVCQPIHAYIVKNVDGSPGVNVTTALIDMYCKCGRIDSARRVFDGMPERSSASWTVMVAGIIRSGDLVGGLGLFAQMREGNVAANEITMLSLVIECGHSGALAAGKWIHAYVLRNGFQMSVVLGTGLVDMYCKCKETESARALFEMMKERDVMTWTVMISRYAQDGDMVEAFELFGRMRDGGVRPNEITMVSLLALCAEAGALDRGRWIHACIDKQGITSDVVLATALVDMYAKCGEVHAAYSVFVGASDRDVCMWNAMVNGFAMNGHGIEAIKLFSRMEKERIRPNDVTFIGVLRACSHSGLVEEGRRFFDCMGRDFGLSRKVEHYGCMVDLLGRAGKLDEALEMINSMPVAPNVAVWGALLASCKVHKNPRLGEIAARELLRLEPDNTGYSVLLSNIYAADNRWNNVAEVRTAIKDSGIRKAPGVSSIEINGSLHEFVMGDNSHPLNERIQCMVAEMQSKLKLAGHIANTSAVLLNVDEEEKETSLTLHSEKLAMAFGLISTAPCTPLRIVKNLRVCDDCHAATKLLSKIYNRVIIVRDRNRFHRFSEGSCSCRDYW